MIKLLKVIGYIVLALPVPVLVLGQCMYTVFGQISGLQSFCGAATAGSAIKKVLDDAARSPYTLRTGGPAGKNDTEWADRQYLRIGEYLKRTTKISADYTVVFATESATTHASSSTRMGWCKAHGSRTRADRTVQGNAWVKRGDRLRVVSRHGTGPLPERGPGIH